MDLGHQATPHEMLHVQKYRRPRPWIVTTPDEVDLRLDGGVRDDPAIQASQRVVIQQTIRG